jgi:hypothetical protein
MSSTTIGTAAAAFIGLIGAAGCHGLILRPIVKCGDITQRMSEIFAQRREFDCASSESDDVCCGECEIIDDYAICSARQSGLPKRRASNFAKKLERAIVAGQSRVFSLKQLALIAQVTGHGALAAMAGEVLTRPIVFVLLPIRMRASAMSFRNRLVSLTDSADWLNLSLKYQSPSHVSPP